MYRRMRTCLFGFFEQAERHKLNSEIVLVDWNPPKNKPLLKDAYKWPKTARYCTIRIIVVPASIHQRYEHNDKIPINNDVAHNVAIRHAKGTFILSSPIDILFSDELFRFLASEPLEEDRFYLANCYGVKRRVTQLDSLENQLSYCRRNIIWTCIYEPRKPYPGIGGIPGLHTGSQGNFQLLHRKYWNKVRGFPEIDFLPAGTDSILSYMLYLAGAKVVGLPEPMRVYHIDHETRTNAPESNWLIRTGLRYVLPKSLLAWLRTCMRRFIPLRTIRARLGISQRSFSELQTILSDLVHNRRSYIFNDETWGLGQEDLEEFVVTP